MKINDMFLRNIHRDIEGVITASKATDRQVYQELDEYVVTKELQGHFRTFFDAYKKGITGNTNKMGVWIQGFFGSGKSHFLKILSYTLENKEINGKTAFDFLTEGDEQTRKIKDPMTIANMNLAAKTPTNVILFNVESKHQTGVEEKNSLVNVFLKVFNDSLGYSTNPKVADLERRLDKKGKYDEFKENFKKKNGIEWTKERHEVDFIQDSVVDSLVSIGYMSEDAAKTWFNKLESDYIISIEGFANLVEEYLQSKGNNEHIVFLVDEIGQYIGGNSDLTLQLQTIVEELGDKSHGKAWVIATSQQAIDKITDIAGAAALDFSKIKGRFETTLSLSSANADEVIQKRILAKNITGQNYLEADYPNYENDINQILIFEDSPELKLYNSAKNYADVYPFIPYQFNLLANILTQISKHSIQGANLSRGERSLLAFFKETAERNANNDSSTLVSLDQFYPSLEKWLNETDNAKVIKQAEENTRIVPDKNDHFNIAILKVLFMIKYVDQNIKPTLNNITNLMICHVNEDKLVLQKKVEIALKILISENLIRQNLKNYVFQTDEEQEVTRLINNIDLNETDIEDRLARDILDDKIGRNQFSYKNPHAVGKMFENRYNFTYNFYVDDYAYRKNSNPNLEVKIITPDHPLWNDETQLILASTKNQMLINLPVDQDFMNHIRTYLQVEKYITTANTSSAIRNFVAVKTEKTSENQELINSINVQLNDFLKQATFYFNNNKLEVSGSDFKACLNDALQQMAKLVYYKNDLVDSAISESDINSLLKYSDSELVAHVENQNVVDDVSRYILLQENKNLTVTMKTLRDNYLNNAPYGFVNEDLEWTIARLFKEGSISLFKNAIPLDTNSDINEISKAISDRKSPEKIRVKLRQKANDVQKKMVRNLGEELFKSRSIVDENNDDTTRLRFNEKTQRMISELNSFKDTFGHYYPQSSEINEALGVLQQVVDARDTKSFFEVLKNKEEELLDWAENYEDIHNFHTSNQKLIWDKARDYISRVEDSTTQEPTDRINSILAGMKNIMKQASPYRAIPKLSELNSQYETEYMKFMESKSNDATDEIKSVKRDVLEDLDSRDIGDNFKSEVVQKFDNLIQSLVDTQTLDQIVLLKAQADTLQYTFTKKFTAEENRRREEAARKAREFSKISQDPPISAKPIKKVRNVYMKDLIKTRQRINSEADVNAFVNKLKQELLSELNDDNELDILL
ncbi:BREX system P-loop protein BrxC [Lactobacillus sp. UCMA15818]|uniref:BREX system P-loop protein BrxC n=1 Tax=Lactobacillus sp. UCMA15818 TaxID=2583394 RepID=UPI0025AF48B4|nr:BREX system P-loop protein BrxC [Lactobacillus sp. UCMA15818]MDN2452149.1 BREX system P-loop protein BrxC [Lactobacillus sp. UCMA15818]